MRKIKLQMAFSTEGWDMAVTDFCIENLKNVDSILLGRVTAEGFIPYWADVANNPNPGDVNDPMGKPLTDIPKVVFSNTMKASRWDNATILSGNIAESVKGLKEAKGKDIIVYGGHSFVSSLMDADLIDEIYFILNPLIPVAIDGEQPILKKVKDNSLVKLQSCNSFDCGLVLLHYIHI